MYSRNRPLVLLSMLGLGAEALRTADFLNRWLMYYPEQELYFGEVAIPGHWSVIPNKAARVLPGTRRGRMAHSLYEGAFRRGFPELRQCRARRSRHDDDERGQRLALRRSFGRVGAR